MFMIECKYDRTVCRFFFFCCKSLNIFLFEHIYYVENTPIWYVPCGSIVVKKKTETSFVLSCKVLDKLNEGVRKCKIQISPTVCVRLKLHFMKEDLVFY